MAAYPQQLERRRTLADGRSVLIRPIRANDEPREREFFDHLSGESRQQRFMKYVRSLSDQLVHFFTHIDYDRHMAFVCEAEVEGKPELVGEARAIMDMMKARGAEVPLPVDVVTASDLSVLARANRIAATEVRADDKILDIGPRTAAAFAGLIAKAGTIVWNGPVGVFEYDQFAGGTKTIALAIAASKAFSIAGGGDTLAAIAKFGIADRISYISTGGGAFLEFLEGRTLPAVEVLEQRAA